MKATTVTEGPVRSITFDFPGVRKCTVMDLAPGLIQLVKLEIEPEMQCRRIGSRVLKQLKAMGSTIKLVAYPDDPNRYEDCRRFYFRNGFVEEYANSDTLYWTP